MIYFYFSTQILARYRNGAWKFFCFEMDRKFDGNQSYTDGRAVEAFVEEHLIQAGFSTAQVVGKPFDFKVIDPSLKKNGEYLLQVKSSKYKIPYMTCKTYNKLIQESRKMNCIPLVCFAFTAKKEFIIFNPETNKILISTQKNAKDVKFKCMNK